MAALVQGAVAVAAVVAGRAAVTAGATRWVDEPHAATTDAATTMAAQYLGIMPNPVAENRRILGSEVPQSVVERALAAPERPLSAQDRHR